MTAQPGSAAKASTVGVIGTGAMGGGVVQSLVRAGIPTSARDISFEAQARAVRHGAVGRASPAELARASDIVIVLVVDASQVETVLFGADGVVSAQAPCRIVLVSSTVDPLYVKDLAPRLAATGVALLDAPVSGGPAKAAAGTMTMMVSGDRSALDRVREVLDRIAGQVFVLGSRPGDASTFKIVNNLLAGANLAAGAEALALAHAAGLDLNQVRDVVNASSGGSWIFADRIARALANDLAPRAAVKLLAKDVAIAATLAERLGVHAPFGKLARGAFAAAAAAGHAEDDDAVLMRLALDAVERSDRC
jgi:3-hydroxyisobutyrate dehydrogenase-like beta-hydroxyacid dehydrogenase